MASEDFHLVIPDGVFAKAGDGLSFALLPAPTCADLRAILEPFHDLARQQGVPDAVMEGDGRPCRRRGGPAGA
jgi:hypothetical protein